MTTEMAVAIVGTVSAVLGATVGGLATSLTERWKYKVETRTDAYKALIDAMAKLGIFSATVRGAPSPAQQARMLELTTDYRTAKSKIALYGSRDVVAALATFSSAHAAMQDDDDAEAYIAFVKAMRKDSFARDYPAFGADFDRMLLRDEQVHGPDGNVTTMRDHWAAMLRAREASGGSGPAPPPPPAAPPPPGVRFSFSSQTKP